MLPTISSSDLEQTFTLGSAENSREIEGLLKECGCETFRCDSSATIYTIDGFALA
jgi:hypothetical protein